jgi:hypothetical protein
LPPDTSVDLSWIPLGAGSPVVELCGRMFEAISARLHRRAASDLYHAALEVSLPSGRFTIEQAPVPDADGAARGVVAVGSVGVRAAGRWRLFRYEVRCWPDGVIPDLCHAVNSPIRLSIDEAVATRILDVLPTIPTPVWGRDEAGVGDMWNSNSVIAWALTRSGIDASSLVPPAGGRAPGWHAGCVVASRDLARPPVVAPIAISNEERSPAIRSR